MKTLFALLGGLFVSLISSGVVLAAAEGAAGGGDSQVKVAVAIAAGVAVAIAAFGAAGVPVAEIPSQIPGLVRAALAPRAARKPGKAVKPTKRIESAIAA